MKFQPSFGKKIYEEVRSKYAQICSFKAETVSLVTPYCSLVNLMSENYWSLVTSNTMKENWSVTTVVPWVTVTCTL